MSQTILISACLFGINCRYDGTEKAMPVLLNLLKDYRLISFCPESLGGLPVPRPPAEIQDGDGLEVLSGLVKVMNIEGQDLTREFVQGAYASLDLANSWKPGLIIIKSKSPSCGKGLIYSGNFRGGLKNGDGVTTALLRQAGFPVFTAEEVIKAPDQILGKNYG